MKNSVEGKKSSKNNRLLAGALVVVGFLLLVVVILVTVLVERQKQPEVVISSGDSGSSSKMADEQKIDISSLTIDSSKAIGGMEQNGNIADSVRGKANSKVYLVEYADMQCPACSNMAINIDAVYEKYKDKVAFVYRHFSLTSHKNARPAAIAVEAAGQQGYYWEMLSALFEKRDDWIGKSSSQLSGLFVNIFKSVVKNGDVDKFKADMASELVAKKVDFDKIVGQKIDEVTGTPTLFINGEEVVFERGGDTIIDQISKKLDEALAK